MSSSVAVKQPSNVLNGVNAGPQYKYNSSTDAADPGSGFIAFNDNSLALITSAYVDNNQYGGGSNTSWLDGIDDSTSTVKGYLYISNLEDPNANYVHLRFSGTSTDSSGYRTLSSLSVESYNGSFSHGDILGIAFSRSGDTGGGILETDADASGFAFVVDEDDFVSDLATKVPTQQSTKAYVDSSDNWTQSLSGSVERTKTLKLYDRVSVFDAMSSALVTKIRDRTTANSDAAGIMTAVKTISNSLNTRGGGVLYWPDGTYYTEDHQASGTQRVGVLMEDNVHHVGAGIGATIVKQKDSGNCHMFMGRGLSNASLSSMTINGNYANQSAPSTGNDGANILFADSINRVCVDNCYMIESYDYAIGINVGTSTDSVFQNLWIENSGADGIDVKATVNDTTRGLTFDKIYVNGFGRDPQGNNEEYAGIDIRGICHLSNIHIWNIDQFPDGSLNRVGVRFHTGGGGGAAIGGAHSSLVNFTLHGTDGSATASSAIIGVHVRDPGVHVSNGVIFNVGQGMIIAEENAFVSGVDVHTCRYGVDLDPTETDGGSQLGTNPHYARFMGVNIFDCTTLGLNLGGDVSLGTSSYNDFHGCQIYDNEKNLTVEQYCVDNKFMGGRVIDPVGATNYTDSGTRTAFRDVLGISFEAGTRLLSDNVLVNQAAAQSPFPSGQDEITLIAGEAYEIEAIYYIDRTAGTTSHNIRTEFGGTATLADIGYRIKGSTSSGGNAVAVSYSKWGNITGAVQATAVNATASEDATIELNGTVECSSAGTLIPQISYSAAPGGAPTAIKGSFFKIKRISKSSDAGFGRVS